MSSGKKVILFDAYCGIGDNIHQRPFVLDALKRFDEVYIRTAFPDIFYAGTGVKCLRRITHLPAVNARSENSGKKGYYAPEPKNVTHSVRFNYGHHIPTIHRPILHSFNDQFKHSDFKNISIKFPCKEEWKDEARKVIGRKAKGKPICFAKLPTLRNEWVGMKELSRNPRKGYIEHLVKKLAGDYYIVSALDLEGYCETIFADVPKCVDMVAHHGEFSMTAMFGLVGISSLIITPPCNTLLMGIAFDVPTFAVFGGFSPSAIYTDPLKTPNYGFVAPKKDCFCFNVNHNCDKDISLTDLSKEFEKFMGRPKKIKTVELADVVIGKKGEPTKVWRFDVEKIVHTDASGKMFVNVKRHGVDRVQAIGIKDVLYRE